MSDFPTTRRGAPARLTGRVALITGGTVGIGRATAEAMAREGATVVVLGRDVERLAAAVAGLEASHPRAVVRGRRADVRNEGEIETAVKETLDAHGRIDILIASAGILRPRGTTLTPLAKTSLAEWSEVIDINLKGVFLSNRAVLPAMMAQRSGHIVNVSSTSGTKGFAFDAAYCASKFGVIGLTQSLAEEVRSYGVKVQALLPGAIETPMWEQNGPFQRPSYALPASRVADLIVHMVALPEDVILEGTVVEPFGKPAREGWMSAVAGAAPHPASRGALNMSEPFSTEGGLEGQVAIVTGGASGIGQATARALAEAGASVAVVDISDDRVAAVVGVLEESWGPGRHMGFAADVRREEDMEAMASRTLERFGHIDILVASAGILRGRGSSPMPLVRISTAEWDEVIDTNLKGMFLSNRAVLPAMIGQRSGNIVNISSVSGKQGRAHDAPYCASKFGVIGMTESLAEEVRGYGIRVQMVIPDAVATPIWEQNGPVPCPPNALPPERVADLIVYMVSQPSDTLLLGAVIAPFKTRARTGGKKKSAAEDLV